MNAMSLPAMTMRSVRAGCRTLTVAAFLAGAIGGSAQAASTAAAGEGGKWSHAYAAYGEPKYPRGFRNFDYVNPDAPKGGTLQLQNPDRRSSFDKFNPFTIKGQSPAGLSTLMFEPLAIRSGDEPGTHLRDGRGGDAGGARQVVDHVPHPSQGEVHNGDPVTAEDMKHVFETLTGKGVAPGVRVKLDGIERAVVLDERTIRFDLKERVDDTIFNVGRPAGVLAQVGARPGRQDRRSSTRSSTNTRSRPARTRSRAVDAPRRIEFARNPDYWARDLGVAKGQYNFDRIIYRYYQDNAIAMEAFKAGEFDFLMEYSARRWARQHQGPKWSDGRIIKEAFPTGFGHGLPVVHAQPAPAAVPGPARAPGDRPRVRLRGDQRLQAVQADEQRVREFRFRRDGACRAPASSRCWSRSAAELPAEVFGPAWVPPRTDTRRMRCART